MADIISSILLKAQGGDQVAREIGKVKKAYEETGKAAQGVNASSVGGASSDPFTKATQGGTGGLPAIGSGAPGSAPMSDPRERERDHYNKNNNNNKSGGFFTNAVNAIGQAGSGNTLGAVSTGIGALGTLGISTMVATAVVSAVGKISEADSAYKTKLWGGLGQKLSAGNYDEFQKKVMSSEKEGFINSTFPLLQAMASGGAKGADYDDMRKMLALNYNTGIDVTSIGMMYGRLQSAGGGGKTAFLGGDVANAGMQAFGKSRATEFYDTVTGAIEGAMTRGFEKGSAIFGDKAYNTFVRPLADLGRFGNVAPEAAKAMFNKVQSNIGSSSMGISSPESAMQFMMMRTPGEGYLDTLRRMSSPDTDIQRFENLQSMAGGDNNKLVQMVMTEYGMGVQEADAYVRSMKTRLQVNKAEALRGGPSGGTRIDLTEVTQDDVLRAWAGRGIITNAGKGLEAGLGGAISTGIAMLSGEPTPLNFSEKALTPRLSAFSKGLNTLGMTTKTAQGDMSQDIMMELSQYEAYKKYGASVASSPEQAAYFKKYSQQFDETLGLLGGTEGAQITSSKDAYSKFTTMVEEWNKQNLDGNMSMLSIVEILEAIKSLINSGVITPTGGTKP